MRRKILGMPLFYKVLIANSIIVGVGAFVGTWLTLSVGSSQYPQNLIILALGFTLAGVVLSAVVNYIVLKAAFLPLQGLQKTAAAVRSGDWSSRTTPAPFSDPQMDVLGDTFNNMLDTLEARNNELKNVASQVIRAQEDERQRIARELHDETAQSLTAVLLKLKLLERANSDGEWKQGLGELREVLVGTMDEVRELSRSLRPPLLDDQGLLAALESYISSLNARLPYRITYHHHGFERGKRLPDIVELVCYRIGQEALTNVLKHANPTTVDFSLTLAPACLELRVKDDGKGFDPALLKRDGGGLGVVGMHERAQLVSGDLQINSAPGLGTEVKLSIPL
jgi:two-component system, NarL family, sensor histidine kinase UhpB